MTNRWLSLILLAMLATASPAAGQKGKAKGKGRTTAAAMVEYRPTVDQYTVVKGDTLWDISARLTGSPWHWPRVWAYNPELTNPHWIYPGDVLRFQPSTQPLPTLAQLASTTREMPPEATAEPEPRRDETSESPPAVSEVRSTPLPAVAARRVRRPVHLFISKAELEAAGMLSNAVTDAILLSPPDEVFITFPSRHEASPGQRFMIFRTAQEVQHPITHQSYGYLTQVTGYVSLRETEDDVGRAVITEAVSEVERGQLVAPLAQLPLIDQQPTLATTALEGYVLTMQPGETIGGERSLVFVDIGAGKGLEPGNRLAVYTPGDPTEPDRKLPATKIGELMAIDVREGATTCIVLASHQEIRPGLKVKTIVR